jgi:hypothetical protein
MVLDWLILLHCNNIAYAEDEVPKPNKGHTFLSIGQKYIPVNAHEVAIEERDGTQEPSKINNTK